MAAEARLSPLGWTIAGAGLCAVLATLSFAAVKMAAPPPAAVAATAAPAELGPLAVFQYSVDEICAAMLKGRSDLAAQCRGDEEAARDFVQSYLQSHALLNEDGTVDLLAISGVAADPLSGADGDPAAIASYCFQSVPDWIGISDCINVLDRDAALSALSPETGADTFEPGP